MRLNRELGADFDLAAFRHRAIYNRIAGRIETHLISAREQEVHVAGITAHFAAGEAMLVEWSCKYTLEDFAQLAAKAALRVAQVWTDAEGLFSVQYLVRSRVFLAAALVWPWSAFVEITKVMNSPRSCFLTLISYLPAPV